MRSYECRKFLYTHTVKVVNRTGVRITHVYTLQLYNTAHSGQLLDILIRCPQRGQTNLLGELGKAVVAEERGVAQQLVTDVGLGRVHGFGAVADVLGGMEHPKCQASQEITRGKKTFETRRSLIF